MSAEKTARQQYTAHMLNMNYNCSSNIRCTTTTKISSKWSNGNDKLQRQMGSTRASFD
ncbi:hypothetical protein BVRB_1g021240 [Beta vulgaris subsp. vulgaris]|nr:hypothetical protein BVRB_1g021240 [Beta vulgaris subsp. vulgaris]